MTQLRLKTVIMGEKQKHKPLVSVAIQGYRNPEMLSLCLASIRTHTKERDTEIIVADSATQEDTRLLMREEFSDILFLPNEKNVGFGAMVNACIENAHGEYIFFVNADTIMQEDTISGLQTFMDAHAEVAICGPSQKNFNGKWENTRFRFYKVQTILYRRTFFKYLPFAKRHLAYFEMRDVDSVEPHAVPWIIGSAMFVRRSAINDVGGMDPRFFMYMEDVDWCRRFWQAGWKVYYHPNISIFHFYGKGSAKKGIPGLFLNKLTRVHIASGFKYFMKYRHTEVPAINNASIG